MGYVVHQALESCFFLNCHSEGVAATEEFFCGLLPLGWTASMTFDKKCR